MKKLTGLFLTTLLTAATICAEEPTAIQAGTANLEKKVGSNEFTFQDLNDFIAKEPTNVRALRGLANIYFAEGKFQEAYNDFNTVVTLIPTSARAYFDRGIVLFAQGKDLQALEDIERALTMDPEMASKLKTAPKLMEKIKEIKGKPSKVTPPKVKHGIVSVKKGAVKIKEKAIGK